MKKRYRNIIIGITVLFVICLAVIFLNPEYNFSNLWKDEVEHNIVCDIALIIAGSIIFLSILSGAVYSILDFIRKKLSNTSQKESAAIFGIEYRSKKSVTDAIIENIKKDM